MLFLCLLALVLGFAHAAFTKLGGCSNDDTFAMRPVFDTGLANTGCYAQTPSDLLYNPKSAFDSVIGSYVEFDIYINIQDDNLRSLKNAALADLRNVGSRFEIQQFVRRLLLGALNTMVGKHDKVLNTFLDCNPAAADLKAKNSQVSIFYDDATAVLSLTFRAHLPQYWVALTTKGWGAPGRPKSDDGITSPQGMQLAMNTWVFGLCTTESTRCGDAAATFQTLFSTVARNSPQASSMLIKSFNPNLKTAALRGRALALKSGKQAKVVAAGSSGKALTARGP